MTEFPGRWHKCDLRRLVNCGNTRWMMPTSPGTYAIYESGRLVYLGSAGNLRWRIRTHMRSGKFSEPIAVKVRLTADSEAARAVERRLIQRLRPSRNKVINVAVKVRRFFPYAYNPYDYEPS